MPTLLSVPMRHRGVISGHFFLAGKADGEAFIEDDEDVLVLFAAQAATAIANARAHRAERQARAQQEAITFRRADGREMALGDIPVGERFRDCETLRAEEVKLSVPDGPSLRTLVNVSPTHTDDGAVASLVITFQDLAALDDAERMCTEFLALVGYELRQPLSSIKGSADTLLEEELDPAEMREFHRIIAGQAGQIAAWLPTCSTPAASRPTRCRWRRAVGRGGSRGACSNLVCRRRWPPRRARGPTSQLADRRRIAQVLDNLLANAARHAPESAPIVIATARQDGHVNISVTDEGRGIDAEALPQVFSKRAAGRRGGHGRGLAICRGLVEAHGGRIRACSPGRGRERASGGRRPERSAACA